MKKIAPRIGILILRAMTQAWIAESGDPGR